MSIFDDVLAAFAAPTANLLTAFSPTTTPTNNPANDAITAGAAIRSAVQAGYTAAILTSSNASWLVPSNTTQMIGIVINGGGKGGTGLTTNAGVVSGGIGGSSGGYLSAQLDLTGITPGTSTLNITVGAAASSAGTAPAQADGGQSSIKFGATTLLAGATNASGIASAEGLIGTTSTPGSGGHGANVSGSGTWDDAEYGTNSGIATGGGPGTSLGNTGGPASNGGAGGTGTSASIPLCGGAGGGGGGAHSRGAALATATGGNGGSGGFPGAGSGGGGAASSGATRTGGTGGIPGNGLVAILYK